MLICSLPVVIHLFPWSSFLHTLREFKHGYIFHINNLNSKSCAFSNIHQTSTPFYTHNIVTMSWINKSFVCLHLYDCCVLVQSYVLSILMNFKLVEVKYFCLYIHLYAYTVRMKTLTALWRTFDDCLNTCKTLIPKSMKWGFSDKYYFPLPDGYFLPHIRLLPQHLQDFVLQFFYSICFSFFLCWIYLENELKAQCDTEICAYNENSLYHTCVIADIL